MTTTIQQSKTVYRCEHCGLEHDHPKAEECPRCARTFFSAHRVTTDEWIAEQRRIDVLERATAAQERVERRRKLASEVRRLLTTGWWGYQIIPADRRRDVARKAMADAR